MIEFLEIIFTAGFWAATIRIACPLILATIGEVLCERAGVLNLGIEGIMSIGAMVGGMPVFLGADLYTGIFAALLIGGLFFMFFTSIKLSLMVLLLVPIMIIPILAM